MQAVTHDPQLTGRRCELLGVSLDVIVATLLSAFITLALSLVSYALLDVSLGTVFAAVFLSAIFAVGIAGVVTNGREWLIVSVVISLASVAPVLLGLLNHSGLLLAGAQLSLLCAVLAAGAIAMVRAIARVAGEAIAAMIVIVLLLAWLTWPVWMSPYFASPVGGFFVDHLLAHQPLFAIGGPYHAMGDWTHAPLAYSNLTNLGQDVMFAPPTSAWSAIASQAIFAGVFGAIAFVGQRAPSRAIKDPGARNTSHAGV